MSSGKWRPFCVGLNMLTHQVAVAPIGHRYVYRCPYTHQCQAIRGHDADFQSFVDHESFRICFHCSEIIQYGRWDLARYHVISKVKVRCYAVESLRDVHYFDRINPGR